MQRCTLLVLSAMVFAATAARAIAQSVTGIPMDELGDAYRVLGRTGTPLGTMVTLHGVVRRGGRDIDDVREPVLQVQKINGRASQESIEVPIRPQGTGFGEPHYVLNLDAPQPPKPDLERSLPRLEFGRTYEFRGYETGGFVGAPDEAAYDGGVCRQSRGFYFASEFVVAKGKRVPPIAFSPADFWAGKRLSMERPATATGGRGWPARGGKSKSCAATCGRGRSWCAGRGNRRDLQRVERASVTNQGAPSPPRRSAGNKSAATWSSVAK